MGFARQGDVESLLAPPRVFGFTTSYSGQAYSTPVSCLRLATDHSVWITGTVPN